MLVEKRLEDPLPNKWIYNKTKEASTNNVLYMEIDIMFGINTNNSSANRREGTDLDTPLDFIKKTIHFRSTVASYSRRS